MSTTVKQMLRVVLILAVVLGAFPVTEAAALGGGSGRKAPVKYTPLRRHLSLMPPLCIEQFVVADPGLNAESAQETAGGGAASASTSPRLSYTTNWGVDPFVGSTIGYSATAPDRTPAPGGERPPGSDPLCQLDAGVSFSLAPGADLNLGYRLPSTTWSSMFRSLGTSLDEPADKQVSVGISIDF